MRSCRKLLVVQRQSRSIASGSHEGRETCRGVGMVELNAFNNRSRRYSKILLEDVRSDSLDRGSLCTQAQHRSSGVRWSAQQGWRSKRANAKASIRSKVTRMDAGISQSRLSRPKRCARTARRFQVHDRGTGRTVGRSCNRTAASPRSSEARSNDPEVRLCRCRVTQAHKDESAWLFLNFFVRKARHPSSRPGSGG